MSNWDPKEHGFDKLSVNEQVKALRELAKKRRDEAVANRAAGFREIADAQIEQAREIEFRARALELEIKGR